MRTRDADILIVPGLGGSGPEHWQSRWQAKLPTARRVEQADWERPDAATWVRALQAGMAEGDKSLVIVAHSLGVIATVRALQGDIRRPIAGAFLVAPPAASSVAAIPEIAADFRPYPDSPLPCPSILVASTDDPYASLEAAEAMASHWGATFLNAGAAGHINTESGHGPWPEGLMSFAGFLSRLAA